MRFTAILALIIAAALHTSGTALSSTENSNEVTIKKEATNAIVSPLDHDGKQYLRHDKNHAVIGDEIEEERKAPPRSGFNQAVRNFFRKIKNFVLRMFGKKPKQSKPKAAWDRFQNKMKKLFQGNGKGKGKGKGKAALKAKNGKTKNSKTEAAPKAKDDKTKNSKTEAAPKTKDDKTKNSKTEAAPNAKDDKTKNSKTEAAVKPKDGGKQQDKSDKEKVSTTSESSTKSESLINKILPKKKAQEPQPERAPKS